MQVRQIFYAYCETYLDCGYINIEYLYTYQSKIDVNIARNIIPR